MRVRAVSPKSRYPSVRTISTTRPAPAQGLFLAQRSPGREFRSWFQPEAEHGTEREGSSAFLVSTRQAEHGTEREGKGHKITPVDISRLRA